MKSKIILVVLPPKCHLYTFKTFRFGPLLSISVSVTVKCTKQCGLVFMKKNKIKQKEQCGLVFMKKKIKQKAKKEKRRLIICNVIVYHQNLCTQIS